MRFAGLMVVTGAALFCAGAAVAGPQSDPWAVRPTTVADLLTRLDHDAATADSLGDLNAPPTARAFERGTASPWAASDRDVWRDGDGYQDRLRLRTQGELRRADGAPVPVGPADAAMVEARDYDVSYTRGWTQALAHTDSGVDVSLTPHAGVGMGSRGGSVEAGATLRIGRDLNRLVPEGERAFGERPRWYLYAAGSGRAVGYNWARTRDGDFARSGVSHDTGSFLGDASLGVAMRKGAMQSSFGLVYREMGVENWRAGSGVDTDVSEGLVAFQLSIKPE